MKIAVTLAGNSALIRTCSSFELVVQVVRLASSDQDALQCQAVLAKMRWTTARAIISSSLPLDLCTEDCDSDAGCARGLTCFQRSEYTAVPCCIGQGSSSLGDSSAQRASYKDGARCHQLQAAISACEKGSQWQFAMGCSRRLRQRCRLYKRPDLLPTVRVLCSARMRWQK